MSLPQRIRFPGLVMMVLVVGLSCGGPPPASDAERLRFAFITCSVEAKFFTPVKQGLADAARMLDVDCDFLGTEGVDLDAQAALVRRAVAEGYDGIALSIIDPEAFDGVIGEALAAGVPVVGFNVDDAATPNPRLSSVNQRLRDAGASLAEHLLPDIPENAAVLLTMHDEGVSALDDRRDGMLEVLRRKNVAPTVIVTGNDAARAAEVIADALRGNPAIRVVLGTGQADTEAAGLAIERHFAGRGFWSAGFDLSPKTLQLIRDGHIRCTVDQQPYIQGFYPVVQLALFLRYGLRPADIDAGAAIIDRSNVDRVASLAARNYR